MLVFNVSGVYCAIRARDDAGIGIDLAGAVQVESTCVRGHS